MITRCNIVFLRLLRPSVCRVSPNFIPRFLYWSSTILDAIKKSTAPFDDNELYWGPILLLSDKIDDKALIVFNPIHWCRLKHWTINGLF